MPVYLLVNSAARRFLMAAGVEGKFLSSFRYLMTLFGIAGIDKQSPSFGAKKCTDICPRTLSVPRSEQFSESEARGKL